MPISRLIATLISTWVLAQLIELRGRMRWRVDEIKVVQDTASIEGMKDSGTPCGGLLYGHRLRLISCCNIFPSLFCKPHSPTFSSAFYILHSAIFKYTLLFPPIQGGPQTPTRSFPALFVFSTPLQLSSNSSKSSN